MRLFEKTPWIAFWRISEDIPDVSRLCRYRFGKPKNNLSPVPSDFMQDPPTKDMSVFETQFLENEDVWKIGQKINPPRTLVGGCYMQAKDVRTLKNNEEKKKFDLLVKRSPHTAPKHKFDERWWHVNIMNCPHTNDEQYKQMALSLVEISKFIQNPNKKN